MRKPLNPDRVNRISPVQRLALTVILLTATTVATAQEAAKPAKLFASDDTLAVTMTGPWRDIERKPDYQGAYPATIEFTDETGRTVKLDMTVERRGVKRQVVCEFPPIRLRFDKETVKGTTFRGEKSLKMVTHCDRSRRYEQYVALEMLAYRMYNVLTDYSFRIRPLLVTYIDSDSGRSNEAKLAFLIEDDGDVAKRHDMKKVRIPQVGPNRLEPELSSLFALYQYMIGNVDWAALSGPDPDECCHNVKLIAPEPIEAATRYYPVPYDFDSAGLVDAEYAAPPGGLGINSVTQRLFRGYCAHNETLPAARELILRHEQDMLALVAGEDRLTPSSRKKAERYLGKFFEIARDPDDFAKNITEKCRR